MSITKTALLKHILADTYGATTATVASVLLAYEWSDMWAVSRRCRMPLSKVRKAFLKLNQHHILKFKSSISPPVYGINEDAVLDLVRWSKYIHIAKTLFGDESELLVEELLFQGQMCLSTAVQTVTIRLKEALEGEDAAISESDVQLHFSKLVENHFVIRCPVLDDDPPDDPEKVTPDVPTLKPSPDPFVLPRQTVLTPETSEPPAKKAKTVIPDKDVLWEINVPKFRAFMRDQLILQLAQQNHHPDTTEVLRAVLRNNELKSPITCSVSNPLAGSDILKLVPANLKISKSALDQHLTLLCEDGTRILTKMGDSSGGVYQIDYISAMRYLAQVVMESVVRENFGSLGLRVFRLLLEKKFLEQAELEKLALLPSKEGKEITYNMLTQNFIFVKELSKSTDFTPSRTFYLFHVDLKKAVQNQIERCSKILGNLIERRHFETKEKRSLLDTVQKVEALIAQIQEDPSLDQETREAQVKEVEEGYLPPAVKQSVEQHKRRMARLVQAEVHVDHSLFILESYIALTSE